MNNELLTLFDIKDDIVESFTIDNIDTYYEINIRFKPSVVCCPHCGSIHFISKGTQKKRLVSTPINDQPVKIITHLTSLILILSLMRTGLLLKWPLYLF